jgi:hypothetical protein
MLAAMRNFLRRRDETRTYLDFDAEAPGWQEWLPPYRPGEAWPWRQPGVDQAKGDAAPA